MCSSVESSSASQCSSGLEESINHTINGSINQSINRYMGVCEVDCNGVDGLELRGVGLSHSDTSTLGGVTDFGVADQMETANANPMGDFRELGQSFWDQLYSFFGRDVTNSAGIQDDINEYENMVSASLLAFTPNGSPAQPFVRRLARVMEREKEEITTRARDQLADEVYQKALHLTEDTDIAEECAECVLQWGLKAPEDGYCSGNYDIIERLGYPVIWPEPSCPYSDRDSDDEGDRDDEVEREARSAGLTDFCFMCGLSETEVVLRDRGHYISQCEGVCERYLCVDCAREGHLCPECPEPGVSVSSGSSEVSSEEHGYC